MPDIDEARNYYADLEVTPTCSEQDIKKQYRKLALLYHPDRHLGQEQEYNARIQAVNTAHEILADPESRAKYDVLRKRGSAGPGRFARPAAPRGNPYQAKSDFPPPRMRTQTRPTSGPERPIPTPPGSSGADRYTKFRPPPPSRATQSSANSDAKGREDLLRGWEHLNKTHAANQSQQRRAHPVPPAWEGARKASNGSPPDSRTGSGQPHSSRDTSPKRSAFEELKRPSPTVGRGSYRKTGFDPANTSGDEPPARHTSNRPVSASQQMPPPPPRGPAPTAKRPEPMKPFRSRSGDDTAAFVEGEPRGSTPYAAPSGEKTYFSTEALRRSASTRDTPSLRSGQNSRERYQQSQREPRPQSASPKSRTGISQEQSHANEGSPRPFIVYSDDSDSDEQGPASTNSNGSSSPDNTASPRPVDPATRRKAVPSSNWQAKRQQDTGLGNGSYASPAREDPIMVNSTYFEMSTFSKTAEAHSKPLARVVSAPSWTSFTSGLNFGSYNHSSDPESRRRANSGALPDARDESRHSQHDKSPVDTSKHDLSDSQGRAFDHSPTANMHNGPSPLHEQLSSSDIPNEPPRRDTFSANHWQNAIKHQNWASAWANLPSGSMSQKKSKGHASRGRTSPVKSPSAVRDTAEEDGEPTGAHYFDTQVHTEPVEDAMDIDDEPPARPHNAPVIAVEDTATRGVKLDPPDEVLTSIPPTAAPRVQDNESILPRPQPGVRQPSGVSLSELKNIEPLGRTDSGGLRHMNDLSSSLPFESKPSAAHPARRNSEDDEMPLKLPRPPKPPLTPRTLTANSWAFYMNEMASYLSLWNSFNSQMVANLQDSAVKQNEMERGPAGGMMESWLDATGETKELGGWETYLKTLKEEQRLRAHWNVACELHMEAVERHTKLRYKVANAGPLN